MDDMPQRTEHLTASEEQRTVAITQRTAMGAAGAAVTLSAIPGRVECCAAGGHEHLLITLSAAADAGASKRLPINVCLAIDRSGSMEGAPLEAARQACMHVVDNLQDTDVLSIVAFADTVDVIMPPRRVVNPALIREHLRRLTTGNTTNLYDGMLSGGNQLKTMQDAGMLSRLIVLTDGDPTAGIRDYASIVQLAGQLKDSGVSITMLGFGPDFNEELLAGIARRATGTYHFISDPAQITAVFAAELEGMKRVAAMQPMLHLRWPANVRLVRVYGQPETVYERSLSLALDDLQAGAAQTRLLEIELRDRPPGRYRLMHVDAEYRNGDATVRLSADATASFSMDPARYSRPVDPVVQREIDLQLAARDLERTVMALRTGQMSAADAAAEMKRTQQFLADVGQAGTAAELTRAMGHLGDPGAQVEKTLLGAALTLESGRRQTDEIR